MKNWNLYPIFLFLTLTFFNSCRDAEDDIPEPVPTPPALAISSNVEEVTFHTTDISLFWQVYDAQAPNFSNAAFVDNYFLKGSDELEALYQLKQNSFSKMGNLLRATATHDYYASIRKNTLQIAQETPALRAALNQLKYLYPKAVFSDVTFTIGALSAGGKILSDGQIIIGSEFFSRAENSPTKNLNNWHQQVIRDKAYLHAVVIHELIHVNQYHSALENNVPFTQGASLLKMALLEGGADFLTDLILGVYHNDHLPAYADPIEAELWAAFKAEMHGQDYSNWLFNGSQSGDQPADLGYYIGYKIAAHYFEQSLDKSAVIRQIIELHDPEAFLAASGYADQF